MLHQARIGLVLNKVGINLLLLDLFDQPGHVAGTRLSLGREADRGKEGDAIFLAKVAKSIVTGQHLAFLLRHCGKLRFGPQIQLLQLLDIFRAALTEIVGILRICGNQRVHHVGSVLHAILHAVPGMRIGDLFAVFIQLTRVDPLRCGNHLPFVT
ncbi:hypothetical protein D3C71_1702120 [compost metagenome]